MRESFLKDSQSAGKTPHETLGGRKSKRQLVESGEAVHSLPLDIKDRPNVDARFQDDMWLGIRLGTGEYVIGTPTGMLKARPIRRKPIEVRWDAKRSSLHHGRTLEAVQLHRERQVADSAAQDA